MPVPAAEPLAVTVLMSTTPGSTRDAMEAVDVEAAAVPDGVTAESPSPPPNGSTERAPPDAAERVDGPAGDAKCAIVAPASAASTTTSRPAASGRRSRPSDRAPPG